MELIPKEKQPVAGSEGAQYRKKQLAKQLPAHDQDPSKCHELSPNEVKQMEQFVKKYKNEVLGVGDIKLPKEVVAQVGESAKPDNGNRSTLTTVKNVEDKGAAPLGSTYVSYPHSITADDFYMSGGLHLFPTPCLREYCKSCWFHVITFSPHEV